VKPACCVIRSKPVRTKITDKATPCPLDHSNRQFDTQASNLLWRSDLTCFRKRSGFGHAAFVIDADDRRIVGWRVSRAAHVSERAARHRPGASANAQSLNWFRERGIQT